MRDLCLAQEKRCVQSLHCAAGYRIEQIEYIPFVSHITDGNGSLLDHLTATIFHMIIIEYNHLFNVHRCLEISFLIHMSGQIICAALAVHCARRTLRKLPLIYYNCSFYPLSQSSFCSHNPIFGSYLLLKY